MIDTAEIISLGCRTSGAESRSRKLGRVNSAHGVYEAIAGGDSAGRD
jgi:hypothetical protein